MAKPRIRKLTDKQEEFAKQVASGENKTQAYRNAYGADPSNKGITARACKLSADPIVSERIKELRDPVVHKVGLTLESHLQTLQDIAMEAREAGHFSAAVAAEVARGKAAGIHVERHENRNLNVNTQLSTHEMKEIAAKLLGKV